MGGGYGRRISRCFRVWCSIRGRESPDDKVEGLLRSYDSCPPRRGQPQDGNHLVRQPTRPHTFSPFVILAVRLGGPNDRRTSKPFATEYYLPSGTVTGPHKAARETDARDDPDRRWVPQRQPIAVLGRRQRRAHRRRSLLRLNHGTRVTVT